MNPSRSFRSVVSAIIVCAISEPSAGTCLGSEPAAEGKLEKMRAIFSELKADARKESREFDVRYERELEGLLKAAGAAGDLDLVLAVREEASVFRSRTGAFEPSKFVKLARLQTIYREQTGEIEARERDGLLKLYDGYGTRLEVLRNELTKAGEIDGAVAVQAEIRKVEGELEVLSARAESGGSSERPSHGEEEPEPLVIVEAFYDSHSHFESGSAHEVTGVLRGKIGDGKLDLAVDNSVLGDPHPFNAKVLKVKYFKRGKGKRPGVPFEITVNEGGRLSLP